MQSLTDQAIATLLISMRIVPTLAFAPPFTMMRVPASVRLLLAVGLAAWLVGGHPLQTWQSDFRASGILVTAAAELLLGIALALTLQLAFAALLTAGRTIDIQAGYGLGTLLDPATKAQMPLVGSVFAYATAAIFFASGGPAEMLALWAASVAQVPLGGGVPNGNVAVLASYMSGIFAMAFGAAGMVILVLFLIDVAIAFMSRTLPQMNVLLLGFQVKTLATLIVLPISLALSATLFLRMTRYALQSASEMF